MEFWDVYNNKRELIGKTMARGSVKVEGQYHLVVHVWIMNKKGEFLIQKRNKNLALKPGMWAATGGAAIAGENSHMAAKRELFEELGIDVSNDELHLIRQYSRATNHTDVYFLNSEVASEDLVLQEEEVEAAKWSTISTIKAMIQEGSFYSHGETYMDIVFNKAYTQLRNGSLIVETERLKLIACDYEMIKDIYYSTDSTSKILGYDFNIEAFDKINKIVPVFKNLMEHNSVFEKWYVWLILNKKFNCIIGDIGFKGKPDELGQVEIGYSISSCFRNSGFATEAFSGLSQWALAQEEVKAVKAKCAEDNLASANVLDKNKMKVVKIEDNLVDWIKTN